MTGGELRRIFNDAPELYQRSRPHYPGELFADLRRLAGIPTGARILEIGPGTGQATMVLAELGARVTAVELGPDLARVLIDRITSLGVSVDVVVAAFEDWPLPDQPFDLITA